MNELERAIVGDSAAAPPAHIFRRSKGMSRIESLRDLPIRFIRSSGTSLSGSKSH